jgi:hypothetical protein
MLVPAYRPALMVLRASRVGKSEVMLVSNCRQQATHSSSKPDIANLCVFLQSAASCVQHEAATHHAVNTKP